MAEPRCRAHQRNSDLKRSGAISSKQLHALAGRADQQDGDRHSDDLPEGYHTACRCSAFTELFWLLREWVTESPGAWPVIRAQAAVVGVTRRSPTTPHAFRWQQEASWTRQLPAASVVNVSLDPAVWSYLGDEQAKLTDSFSPAHWLDRGGAPARGEITRRAMAEAVAVVAHGRSSRGRQAIARGNTPRACLG